MVRIPKVTMTVRELDRLKCIQRLIDGQLKQARGRHAAGTDHAPGAPACPPYEQQGPVGLISKLRNRPGFVPVLIVKADSGGDESIPEGSSNPRGQVEQRLAFHCSFIRSAAVIVFPMTVTRDSVTRYVHGSNDAPGPPGTAIAMRFCYSFDNVTGR
jgi:hypothetical protein